MSDRCLKCGCHGTHICPASPMGERCGLWMQIGRSEYETLCFRPIGHDGSCRPARGELMSHSQTLVWEDAQIRAYIAEVDEEHADEWPVGSETPKWDEA